MARAVCLVCGVRFEALLLGAPQCPNGHTEVAVELPGVRAVGETTPVTSGPTPEIQAQRRHAAATASTIRLACDRGHEWGERIETRSSGSCPHGVDGDGESVQVTLDCPCGARYAVVGEVGERSCPMCGRAMVCGKCLAERAPDPERQVACPTCQSTHVRVLEAPPISFRGAVVKTIP